jgi:hypothetical protein
VKQIHVEKDVSIKVMVLQLGKIHLMEDAADVDVDMIKEGYCIG